MTMLQRYILIVSLAGAALVAHLTFCGWGFGYQTIYTTEVLVGWSGIRQSGSSRSQLPVKSVYGCYAKGSLPVSVFGGMLLPWGLLTASAILLAGRTRALRRERGRCIQCGYDLRGEMKQGCPECGWNRDSTFNKT